MNTIRLGLALALALAGLLPACSLTAPQAPERYHVLSVPSLGGAAATAPGGAVAHHPATLLVAPSTGVSFYDTQEIVFSRSEGTRSYYRYNHWTEPPSQRMSTLLLDRLAVSGAFRAVADGTSGVQGRWLLRTHLVEILHEAGAPPGTARVVVTAELSEPGRRALVARRTFTGSAPAPTHDADGATRALGVALGSVLDQVAAWADGAAVD
jgi:cholesterol transport system auxiliary component